MEPLRLRATGQPSAWTASVRSSLACSSWGDVQAGVGDPDALEDQHLALELDLTSGVPHQTGGVDPPGREGSGECLGESTERGADQVVDGAGVAGSWPG
jgi:hypothetical protein